MRIYKVHSVTRAIVEMIDVVDVQTIERLPFRKGEIDYLPEVRGGPDFFMREYQTLDEAEPQVMSDHVEVVVSPAWRPVEDLLAVKKAEIAVKRDQALSSGITWAAPDGTVHRIQSDAVSRDNLTGTAAGIAAGLPLPTDFRWRTSDNIDVALDAAGLLSLAGAMLLHVNACWQASWTKKAEIDALTDPADIAGYDATAGWPA